MKPPASGGYKLMQGWQDDFIVYERTKVQLLLHKLLCSAVKGLRTIIIDYDYDNSEKSFSL